MRQVFSAFFVQRQKNVRKWLSLCVVVGFMVGVDGRKRGATFWIYRQAASKMWNVLNGRETVG